MLGLHHRVNQTKTRKTLKRSRAPNCTHLDMDRVYGEHQKCDVCGRPPSLGFLYECRQDWDTQSLHDQLATGTDAAAKATRSNTRAELEAIGLSESVIIGAEQGRYTSQQLEKLKTLKKHLRQTISDSLQASGINDAEAQLAALAQTASSNDGALDSTLSNRSSIRSKSLLGPPACVLKACHTCRPYYRDRVFISFQAVIEADFAPVTREDAECLPTKSALILKAIGNECGTFSSLSTSDSAPLSLPTTTSLGLSIQAPPTASTSTSSASELTFKTTQTDLDAISNQRHPRRRFYRLGRSTSGDIAPNLYRQSHRLSRQGLKSALHGIFRSNRYSSSEGSNITLPIPRTGTVRNSSEVPDIGDFDLPALRKVGKEQERMDFRHGASAVGFEHGPSRSSETMSKAVAEDEAASPTGDLADSADSVMDSCESRGSEVQVEGGLALTEEAVDTHTPDILALDLSSLKIALAAVQDVEMDVEEADIGGLQSIMAQV
ncbi:hypothetical protein ACEQ8H_002121 [Pleosporales sp. CAS-2024a]